MQSTGALLAVVGLLLVAAVVALLGRSAAADVCPAVVRDPAVIAKYGASPTCAFKSSGWGQTVVRVSGEKGSGTVLYENGRVFP